MEVFGRVLGNGTRCARVPGSRVLDIGANEGIYGLMAAKWGCSVTMFEPQPHCVALLNGCVLLNNIGHRATIVPGPVSDSAEGLRVSPATGCSGVFGKRQALPVGAPVVEAKGVNPALLFGNITQPIVLVKIDVEGLYFAAA